LPFSPAALNGIDAQALAHYNAVIADGGVIPGGLTALSNLIKAIKAIYGVTDINSSIPVIYDAHYLGYKLGAGVSGTATNNQAATKLYSLNPARTADETQTTAANQPLLLAHAGGANNNYWFGSKTGGNYCSLPHASSNSFRNDFEIIAYDINLFLYSF
jgi:hypothetical protein